MTAFLRFGASQCDQRTLAKAVIIPQRRGSCQRTLVVPADHRPGNVTMEFDQGFSLLFFDAFARIAPQYVVSLYNY